MHTSSGIGSSRNFRSQDEKRTRLFDRINATLKDLGDDEGIELDDGTQNLNLLTKILDHSVRLSDLTSSETALSKGELGFATEWMGKLKENVEQWKKMRLDGDDALVDEEETVFRLEFVHHEFPDIESAFEKRSPQYVGAVG